MTEEESQQSRLVRDHFRVVSVQVSSAVLLSRVERLAALASEGDRAGIVAELQSLIPGYAPALAELAAP